MWRRGEKH
jgi:hypothetical protein